jgi:hypothetical protein
MFLRVFFIAIISLFSSLCFADFTNFPNDLKQFISDEQAEIVQINDLEIDISKGVYSGYFKGRRVNILRISSPIYHPVTKELLGTRKIKIGSGVVKEADFTSAKILITESSYNLDQAQDIVKPAGPILIKFAAKEDNEENSKYLSLLKASFNNEKNIFISNDANIVAELNSDENGISIDLKTKDNKPLKTFYYSTVNIANITREIKSIDLIESNEIDKKYISIAYLYTEKGEFIAAADKETIDFYEVKSGKIEKVNISIKGFSEIVSIDSYDINGDSNEELIVSNLDINLTPSSSIYRINGNKTEAIKTNLSFLFRTVYKDRQKTLIYQKVLREAFDSKIYKFTSLNEIGKGEPILNNRKFNIYNIGFGDFNKDGIEDIIYFNSDKKIEVISDNKVIYKSGSTYGFGANYFLLNKAVKTKENHGYTEGDDILGLRKFRYYVFPRIFEKDGEFFVYNNELKFPAFPLKEIYGSSKIEKISFNNLGVEKKWESDMLDPRIIDIYMYPEGGRTVLLVLKNNSSGFIWEKNKSSILYLRFN